MKQKEGLASGFLARINEHLARGPKIPDQEDLRHFTIWAEKMLRRVEKNDAEGDYRRHWLLKDSLEHYFDRRGMWYLGPKKSMAWLKENDRKTYDVLAVAYRPAATIDEIRIAVQAVCGS